MPRLRNEFPRTLLRTTITVKIRVFLCCSAVIGPGDGWLIACFSAVGGCPLAGDKSLALGAKRHVLARLLGQALALAGIEYGLAHHAPDHARAEVVFAIEALDRIHQLAPVEARVGDVGKLVPGLVGHG